MARSGCGFAASPCGMAAAFPHTPRPLRHGYALAGAADFDHRIQSCLRLSGSQLDENTAQWLRRRSLGKRLRGFTKSHGHSAPWEATVIPRGKAARPPHRPVDSSHTSRFRREPIFLTFPATTTGSQISICIKAFSLFRSACRLDYPNPPTSRSSSWPLSRQSGGGRTAYGMRGLRSGSK